MNQLTKEPASFKDPDGNIFYYKDFVLRKIVKDRVDFFKNVLAMNSVTKLMKKSRLVNSEAFNFEDDFYIKHEKINFLSYPFEWSPLQLADAAIATLEIQHKLLDDDLCLKDATPYNIQFVKNQAVFIDFGSIAANNGSNIWLAYNQFLESFYYPLILYIEKNISLKKTFLADFNGINIEEASKIMGAKVYSLKYFFDLGLPMMFRGSSEKAKNISHQQLENKVDNKKKELNLRIQKAFIQSLINKLTKLKARLKQRSKSQWSDYTESIHYGDNLYQEKKEILSNLIKKSQAKKMIDFGCNTGDFSLLGCKQGLEVVSLDYDINCINTLYDRCCKDAKALTPITMDLANPSPDLGWRNQERKSLIKRLKDDFQAELVLALALMHHLLITARVPLEEILEFFHQVSNKHLIIEFVGKDDKMFIETLGSRENIYQDITRENFELVLSKNFDIIERHDLSNGRSIYLLEKQ